MLSWIKGQVFAKSLTLYIRQNDTGYSLTVGKKKFDSIKVGKTYTFFVFSQIKNENLFLYGFETLLEKDIFESLLGISGIGAKLALNILDNIGISELILAVENENYKKLEAIPGVGKKVSHQIVLGLEKKLKRLPHELSFENKSKKDDNVAEIKEDLHSALLNLGFSPTRIQAAIASLDFEQDFEILLKNSLKNITRV